MESILGLAFSSLVFMLVYQFLAPWFSGRTVTFSTPDLGPKFLFGLLMSLGTALFMSFAVFAFVFLLLPFFVLAAAAPGPMTFLLVMGGTGLAVLLSVQVSHWVMTIIAGKLMPSTITVPSAGAAWKAAWAPTVVTLLPYLFMVFLPLVGFSILAA